MSVHHALTDGIYCVDADYMAAEIAAIYIIHEGDEVAIVETGTFHSLQPVLAALKQLDLDPAQVKYVIPTHVHLDHAGGASTMMTAFEQARLIIHPLGARHMIDPTKLIAGSMAVYGENLFRRLYGEIQPIEQARVDIAGDLDSFNLGGRRLLFIDTPGHARHHFCVYDERSQGIFTGDTFGLAYPPLKQHALGLIASTPPVQFDPPALFASIDKLLGYQPKWMYLTHFGEIDNPAQRAVGLKTWIETYVELCERLDPLDNAAELKLIEELRTLTLARFSDLSNISQQSLARLLHMDMKLNAQGLAHWWRTTPHG